MSEAPLNSGEIIAAARRSEQALCEQIGRWESLDFGVAFISTEFPSSVYGNQLRDVWLAQIDPGEVYTRAEAYYSEQNLHCYRWVPAIGQDVDAVARVLAPFGWRRNDLSVMTIDREQPIVDVDSDIRILPARAMPKAYRQSLQESQMEGLDSLGIGLHRLNDSRFESFVAVVGNHPLGRAAYLEVGETARLMDFFVAEHSRREKVGLALLAHFLLLVRRLMPRYVVTCLSDGDSFAAELLTRSGFISAGSLPQFDRPGI